MREIGEMELDVLKEIANMGAGHAATSLSEMLGVLIEMDVPEIKLVDISKLHRYINGETVVPGVVMQMDDMGSEKIGYIYLYFPEETVKVIVENILDGDKEAGMIESTLMELGNILSSSFCNAVGEFLGIPILPTPPTYARDYILSVVEPIIAEFSINSDRVIIFTTELKNREFHIDIPIMLFPDERFFEYFENMSFIT